MQTRTPDQKERRSVVVTGASTGLGRAIATAFGALGWKVAIGARRADRLAETETAVTAAGGEVFAHPLDVTEPASIQAFYDAAEAALGPLEVLVNNAGMTTPGPVASLSADELKRVFETNTLGAIFCAQESIRRWERAGFERGDLIFISSETAARPWPQNLPYGASKAALEHLARGLRLELAGTGTRISVIQLGPAESEFGFGWDPEKTEAATLAWAESRVLLHGAMMKPEEVADGVVLTVCAPRGVEVHDLVIKPTHPTGGGSAA